MRFSSVRGLLFLFFAKVSSNIKTVGATIASPITENSAGTISSDSGSVSAPRTILLISSYVGLIVAIYATRHTLSRQRASKPLAATCALAAAVLAAPYLLIKALASQTAQDLLVAAGMRPFYKAHVGPGIAGDRARSAGTMQPFVLFINQLGHIISDMFSVSDYAFISKMRNACGQVIHSGLDSATSRAVGLLKRWAGSVDILRAREVMWTIVAVMIATSWVLQAALYVYKARQQAAAREAGDNAPTAAVPLRGPADDNPRPQYNPATVPYISPTSLRRAEQEAAHDGGARARYSPVTGFTNIGRRSKAKACSSGTGTGESAPS